MDIILLEKIHRLGDVGDRVQVRSGYSRNYLIPQGKALLASAENMRWVEEQRAELDRRESETLAKAQERAAILEQATLEVRVRAGQGERLYGSIGPNEIAQAAADAGIELSVKELRMSQGRLSQLGEHFVKVQLRSDVSIQLQVMILALPE